MVIWNTWNIKSCKNYINMKCVKKIFEKYVYIQVTERAGQPFACVKKKWWGS